MKWTTLCAGLWMDQAHCNWQTWPVRNTSVTVASAVASRYVQAAVSSWGIDGFRCLQTYPYLMFMVCSHLPKATQSMSGTGTFCCLSWRCWSVLQVHIFKFGNLHRWRFDSVFLYTDIVYTLTAVSQCCLEFVMLHHQFWLPGALGLNPLLRQQLEDERTYKFTWSFVHTQLPHCSSGFITPVSSSECMCSNFEPRVNYGNV
jgi:hypothetical protein